MAWYVLVVSIVEAAISSLAFWLQTVSLELVCILGASRKRETSQDTVPAVNFS